MSDLIRKSDVIKLINCFAFSLYKEQDDKIKKVFKEYVEKMPAAYDMDNVANAVEEITERILNNCDEIELDWPEEERTVYDMNEDILKIRHLVKHGCIETDDVCEWESDYGFISDKYKRETGCGYTFYDLHHAVPFKYCPYCGKKIKVVVE